MGLPFENADYNEDEVGARKIPELTDVVLTNVQNDNVLVYNNGIWENQAQSSSITELDDIPGVTITNAQNNQFLKYDNGEWINSNITDNDTDNLNDLTDTLLTTPFGNDEVLKYSTQDGKWVNGNIPIEKLSNVYISNLQDGETLRYVQQNTRWENANNIDTLNELSDVTISSNLNNHVLKYNNSTGVYENQFVNLTELADTNITTLNDNNILIYKIASQKWEPGNLTYTETDPVFTASPAGSITNGTGFLKNNGGTWSYDNNTYLTSLTEADPVFTASPAGSITNGNGFLKNNGSGTWSYDTNVVVATASRVATWDTAYGWGDHAIQGYLKSYTETDPVFNAHTVSNILDGNGFLKNNGSGTWSYDTNTYLTSAEIYNLGGLTWNNLADNELIRRVDATNAEGAGMKLIDTAVVAFPQNVYNKTISYFNRASPLNIQFGAIDYQYTFAGYNQRIIPYSPILLSTTLVSGLYLHHVPSINDFNVRVGVNNQYPSQDFQVGTTLYVNDTDGKVGIGIDDPDENLEVDGSIQIDSNTAARLKFQHSGTPQTAHALGEIDAEQDPVGGNGGDLQFYTKVNGGSVTEKLRINNVGAIGLMGANFGDEHNILQSNGSGNPPEWTNTLNVESINAGNTTSNTISSFTRVLVKMIQSIFKFYDLAENILASISSVADGAGGKMSFYTTNATSGLEVKQLTIKESGAIGIGNTEDCGTAGQVLTSNDAGNAVSWTTPTAPPPGAFGVFFVDGLLTISANTAQQVNNLVQDTRFPLTGMSIIGKQLGNTLQPITINDAGTYLFTYSINAQQLSGSTLNTFEVRQNGVIIHYNWYLFSGIENITGSFMANQGTANETYTFLATASSGGSYRLNGFNNQWTQLSITKLF